MIPVSAIRHLAFGRTDELEITPANDAEGTAVWISAEEGGTLAEHEGGFAATKYFVTKT
jgi:hypothetical protein